MKNSRLLATLLLAAPLTLAAQTKPAPAKTTTPATTIKPGTEQVTEVTEDLDPNTGKVIRRTTRTTTVPVGTTPAGTAGSSSAETSSAGAASDTAVSDFYREATTVAKLTGPQLVDAYSRFIEKVREDRRGWKPTEWNQAAAVLASLNGRYDQLRPTFSLDDKLTIRSAQAEFQALRTAKQISGQVSEKL
ncbi:MAG: hypothetical protein M3Y54_13895 [Bacteroidota bacterium]|nr:hypothetical protein [Bacteroidota bacterium]